MDYKQKVLALEINYLRSLIKSLQNRVDDIEYSNMFNDNGNEERVLNVQIEGIKGTLNSLQLSANRIKAIKES